MFESHTQGSCSPVYAASLTPPLMLNQQQPTAIELNMCTQFGNMLGEVPELAQLTNNPFCRMQNTMPTTGMSKLELRNLAADCYLESSRDKKAAARLLLERLDGRAVVSRPVRFCCYWGERRIESGSVKDRPRAGRPKKLTSVWVDAVLTDLSKGYARDDSTGRKLVPYRSWSQFCCNSPVADACLSTTRVTPRHLLRVCLAALPTLKRVKIQLRVWLKPVTKQARVDECEKLLLKSVDWMDAVIWCDGKTLYINPTTAYAWVNTADMSPHDLVREDRRVRVRGGDQVKLKFYIAVNAKVGPVKLVWVTGTTELTADRVSPPYQVICLLSFNAHVIGWAVIDETLVALLRVLQSSPNGLLPCYCGVLMVQPNTCKLGLNDCSMGHHVLKHLVLTCLAHVIMPKVLFAINFNQQATCNQHDIKWLTAEFELLDIPLIAITKHHHLCCKHQAHAAQQSIQHFFMTTRPFLLSFAAGAAFQGIPPHVIDSVYSSDLHMQHILAACFEYCLPSVMLGGRAEL